MPTRAQAPEAVPRLTYLRIKNYRALRDVEFRDLTPLTVLIGPNGSGKSTVLDALAFLAEVMRGNLTQAWENRNRFRGMRTRESDGNIEFEVEFFSSDNKHFSYQIHINEGKEFPRIYLENLYLLKKEKSRQLLFEGRQVERDLYYRTVYRKDGKKIKPSFETEMPPGGVSITLSNAMTEPGIKDRFNSIWVSNKVQAKKGYSAEEFFPDIISYIESYRYLHLTDDHLKGYSDEGPRERLSANGDNLPNVLYYLHLKHPETLARITAQLRRWVPGLADVITEITSDERLLLRFKDAPFEKPLPAQYMSGGTMRLAALLTLLYEPGAAGLLGIEEPENELHPQLLPRLAEELGKASETRQLLVATHSPALLNGFEPEQVWILHRGADGYTQATRTADIPNVKELVEDGSPLGYLWTSNSLIVGDPLAPRPASSDAR